MYLDLGIYDSEVCCLCLIERQVGYVSAKRLALNALLLEVCQTLVI